MSKSDVTDSFEGAVAVHGEGDYVLRLYVAGMTPRSTQALDSIKRICERYLRGRYDLKVIDIYKHPATAKAENVVAMPTLVKKLPVPLRRMIGDLSSEERVLRGLNLTHLASGDG